MAFFSAISSSIGTKLLLFGLRQIDILDKDPADFVKVDVGKKTTLEVRDVGLHVKKLVSLLHLKLPSELQLSRAQASLLRVTFVLDFGVPKIIIEVNGIQVNARLVEDPGAPDARSRGKEAHLPRSPADPRLPPHRGTASTSPPPRASSDASSESDDERIPTIDDLAQSFIREEPAEEIRELKEVLSTQSEHMQESYASSDGDEEEAAGVGAPLGLPTMLKNLLNTALDRLEIVANHIDISVEDQFSDPSSSYCDGDDSPVALNFHVDRVAIDSVTSPDVRVDTTSTTQVVDPVTRLGKRRLRIEKLYARLISDAERFTTMSRVSRPSSAADSRSETSASQNAASDNGSRGGTSSMAKHSDSSAQISYQSVQSSLPSSLLEGGHPPAQSYHDPSHLTSSLLTTDEDRFADAASDEGLENSRTSDSSAQSQRLFETHEMSTSSFLYDDEGLMDYALRNDIFSSGIESSGTGDNLPGQFSGVGSTEDVLAASAESYSSSRSAHSHMGASISEIGQVDRPSSPSRPDEELPSLTDNLDSARRHIIEEEDENIGQITAQHSINEEDLAESKLFTHDDAESMYMSAMSAALPDTSLHHNIPGGWDSASSSSQDTSSAASVPITSGNIPEPPEVDDGCETPRPSSPQSTFSSPRESQKAFKASMPEEKPVEDADGGRRLAKVFLTVDQVTVWFPLSLSSNNAAPNAPGEIPAQHDLTFSSPKLGEDSVFQDIPGSFSNYAHSTSSRRKGSIEFASASKGRTGASPVTSGKAASTDDKTSSSEISLEVGSVICHADISSGRILFQMANRILKGVFGKTDAEQRSEKPQIVPDSTHISVDVSIKTIGVVWLEQLVAESLTTNATTRSLLDINPIDSILRIQLSAIYAASRCLKEGMQSKVLIGRFILSSLDQDIVAFQPSRPRSRRSMGNAPEQLNNDIEIGYEQSTDRRITVKTRPIKVTFNVQRLDDALSSFGGFSGVLELGSSISSGNIIHNSPVSAAPKQMRGVHFGDSPQPPPQPSPSDMPKIDVQFGEVAFVLTGRTCALQLQTTAVRLAIRRSNFRLKVAEVHLSGPYVDASQVGAPLMVEVKDTTVNFLFEPEEVDLTRLIFMINPSKDPYENDGEILIETLLRQRRKGSVLRVELASVGVRISDPGQLRILEALGAELSRLSKVAKYLPDDDRPGILTLALIRHLDVCVPVNEKLGDISISLDDTSVAHVGVPALFALQVGYASVKRDQELLVHEVVQLRRQDRLPMIMARVVGDELEPIVKLKLFNLCAEYRVSTVMVALGISDDGTGDDILLGLASSVATITGAPSPKTLSRQTSDSNSPSTVSGKPLQVDLLLRHCAIGLNPRKITSKALFVMSDAHLLGKQMKADYSVVVELRKASIHAIDDIGRITSRDEPSSSGATTSFGDLQLLVLRESGYVSLSSISAAKVSVSITKEGENLQQLVDVEFRNELLVLESCADSTQTLIAILSGLQPPSPPNSAQQYRNIVPLQEMMESFTGDAVDVSEGLDEAVSMDSADPLPDEIPTNLEFEGSFYGQDSLSGEEDTGDSVLGEEDQWHIGRTPQQYEITGEESFAFKGNYLETYLGDSESDSKQKGIARKWNSAKNQYHLTNEFRTSDAPLKVRVRDTNIIWNLYDGYDWPRTRGIIYQAVEDVEARAEERRQRLREQEDDDEDFVEQDYLFNSVWIGVPIKEPKGALARRINHDIDDLVSETGSYATSTATRSTGATTRPRSSTKPHRRKLKLERSKHKKIAFQLSGIAVDLVVYSQNSGETQNSVDVRLQDLEIYDHMPSSTWKKFVTSLVEPSKREMGRPMIHLELLTVKPITELAASELVIKVTVLPLRLHVDQDALDFITRFFEFKDELAPESGAPSEQPFIQRLEVMAVTLKLDYKPKRVDYHGLRSGHTTEFMNFLILDGADIILRHAIVYGITSFDKLHKTLNDVWMPDVKRNQLPGVLSGLAAVRPLVNVGSGVRDLLYVSVQEYKKDGRIVRSLQKGVYAFAKNTTTEAARLGAKVAIGTQNLLEGAETFLNPQSPSTRTSSHSHDWDDIGGSDSNEDEPRAVSNYAKQPIGVKAGLRSAARHLERDLLTAKDAVIAIPSEVMEEGSGVGMAKAIARRAPTIIIRPALGATKAVSNALLGVGNALDEDSERKIGNKYKSH